MGTVHTVSRRLPAWLDWNGSPQSNPSPHWQLFHQAGRISAEDSCLCWGLGQNSTLRRGYIGGLVLYGEVTFPHGLTCASTHYSTAPVRGAANPSTGRDPQQLFCLEEPLPVSRGAELWGTITVKPCWDKRARLSNSHEVSSGVLST